MIGQLRMETLLAEAPVVRKPPPPERCYGTGQRPVSYSERDGGWLCRSCYFRTPLVDGLVPRHDIVHEPC